MPQLLHFQYTGLSVRSVIRLTRCWNQQGASMFQVPLRVTERAEFAQCRRSRLRGAFRYLKIHMSAPELPACSIIKKFHVNTVHTVVDFNP